MIGPLDDRFSIDMVTTGVITPVLGNLHIDLRVSFGGLFVVKGGVSLQNDIL